MLAYLDRFSIDQLELFKLWFFAIYTVSTIGVVIGVYLEYEKFKKSTQAIGRAILIMSLAADVTYAALIFSTDAEISRRQRNALLEVRQRTANRDISPRDMQAMSSKLAIFSGQKVVIAIFPVTFESDWLAQKIYGILLGAHWDVSFPKRLSVPPQNLYQGGMIEATKDGPSQKAARALFEVFKPLPLGIGFTNGPLSNSNIPEVYINVGGHPAPLRTWVNP